MEGKRSVPTTLSRTEIHVWWAVLPTPVALNDLVKVLSPDEARRAGRYRRNEDATRFVTARATLRRLLGEYLGEPPSSIRFSYSRAGRPSVLYPLVPDLDISISHSAGAVLIGLSRGRRIGADVEYISPTFPFSEVAANSFAQEERDILESVSDVRKRNLFFALWTAREALAKATGLGLTVQLADVGLALRYSPEGAIQVVHPKHGPYQCECFTPLPRYAAAVAYSGSLCEVRLLAYESPGSCTQANCASRKHPNV